MASRNESRERINRMLIKEEEKTYERIYNLLTNEQIVFHFDVELGTAIEFYERGDFIGADRILDKLIPVSVSL